MGETASQKGNKLTPSINKATKAELEKVWTTGLRAYRSGKNLQKVTRASQKQVYAFVRQKKAYTKFLFLNEIPTSDHLHSLWILRKFSALTLQHGQDCFAKRWRKKFACLHRPTLSLFESGANEKSHFRCHKTSPSIYDIQERCE